MLDGFLQWKSKQLARATPFEVHIYPHVSVGDGLSALGEEMSYSPIQIHEPARDLPLKFYQAHPVMGKKILCFFFEPEGERELSFVLTGNTWTVEGNGTGCRQPGVGDGVMVPGENYRSHEEFQGRPGARGNQRVAQRVWWLLSTADGNEAGGCRALTHLPSCLPSSGFLKNIDVTDNDAKQQLLGIVDILHKQGCRVVVDPAPESESPVATFLDQLREIECLHFAA